jgi:polar amino acid transport system permease protein/polar amino acid transport system substrate-binding protein
MSEGRRRPASQSGAGPVGGHWHSGHLVVAVLFVLGACRGAAAQGLSELKARGTIRVAALTLLPEFYALQDGAPPGFDRELIRQFAGLHGLRVELAYTGDGFEGGLAAVTDGRADVLVGGIVATTERRQRLDFCAELLPTRHVVLNRRPSPPVASLEALRLQRVGTVPETSWARMVAEAGVPPAQVVGFRDLDALREGLRSGKVNAVVLALGTALLEIRKDKSAQTGLLLGPVGSVAWGVRKGNGDLLAALDNYVRNLRRTATWDRLIVKYWGERAPEVLKAAHVAP